MSKNNKQENKTTKQFTDLFSGVIGQEYDMLKLICPLATEMSRWVGKAVELYCKDNNTDISVFELGGGTGITTLSLLLADDTLSVISVDNEPVMQNQAKASLKKWVEQGRLIFSADDALTALRGLKSNSLDIVASAYTIHNFHNTYRKEVICEIYRVLKQGGQFINGDRYALDDISQHTQAIQLEVSGYFKVLSKLDKLDILEHWIVHLFNDESENHVMRESLALEQLKTAGFNEITLSNRLEVNALVTAIKY